MRVTESANAPPGRSTGRILELDGIRAVAILTVIVWHYVHLKTTPEPGTVWAKANMLFRLTWSGVDLFFVLSGFLIGGILLSQRESADYFRVFYLRRICRIFPLYFGFLAICAVMQTEAVREAWPGVGWMFTPRLPFESYLTFTQNFAMAALNRFANQALNITWSLAIEEQFYLLLPVMIRFIPLHRLPVVLLALIAAGAGLRVFLYTYWPSQAGLWCYVLLPCRWDPLFLGVLGAWALRQPGWGARLATAGRTLWITTVLLGLVVVAGAITAKGVIMAPAMTLGGYFVLGLFYFSAVMLVVSGHAPRFAAILRHPWLVHIGVISYGIYLLHETMDGVVHAVILNAKPRFQTAPEMLVTLLAFAITLVVASASWRWFERPFVEWSHRRFRYQKR